jgi:hypothetical protein
MVSQLPQATGYKNTVFAWVDRRELPANQLLGTCIFFGEQRESFHLARTIVCSIDIEGFINTGKCLSPPHLLYIYIYIYIYIERERERER